MSLVFEPGSNTRDPHSPSGLLAGATHGPIGLRERSPPLTRVTPPILLGAPGEPLPAPQGCPCPFPGAGTTGRAVGATLPRPRSGHVLESVLPPLTARGGRRQQAPPPPRPRKPARDGGGTGCGDTAAAQPHTQPPTHIGALIPSLPSREDSGPGPGAWGARTGPHRRLRRARGPPTPAPRDSPRPSGTPPSPCRGAAPRLGELAPALGVTGRTGSAPDGSPRSAASTGSARCAGSVGFPWRRAGRPRDRRSRLRQSARPNTPGHAPGLLQDRRRPSVTSRDPGPPAPTWCPTRAPTPPPSPSRTPAEDGGSVPRFRAPGETARNVPNAPGKRARVCLWEETEAPGSS